MERHLTAASVSIEPFEVSRWRLRRTRARMDFEWCFGTFVPCFGGATTKGGTEPAKHGIDHTPDPVAMQWPCLPEHKLRTLRTRSVRRASGLVQTALSEKCGPPGVVLGAKTRFAPELVPVGSSALRQVTGFRTGRGARALSRHIGSSTAGLGPGPCTSAVCALYVQVGWFPNGVSFEAYPHFGAPDFAWRRFIPMRWC